MSEHAAGRPERHHYALDLFTQPLRREILVEMTPPAPHADERDILTSIDQAIGCQQCGAPLDGSDSDDFCGQDCQAAWHADRVGAWVDDGPITVRDLTGLDRLPSLPANEEAQRIVRDLNRQSAEAAQTWDLPGIGVHYPVICNGDRITMSLPDGVEYTYTVTSGGDPPGTVAHRRGASRELSCRRVDDDR